MTIPRPLHERFEAKVDRSGECHLWTGSTVRGYGQIREGGEGSRMRKVHHIALELVGIEVPPGMTVDHVWARGCRHKNCVRVDHLEVVGIRENTLRSTSPSAENARKTHCIRGHEFTPDNTGVQYPHAKRRLPGRKCLACGRMHSAAYQRRQAALRKSTETAA